MESGTVTEIIVDKSHVQAKENPLFITAENRRGDGKETALVDEVPTEFHLKNAVQLQTKPPNHI